MGMAGRSRYRIVLSDEERSELEHRSACYSRPHREVLRAKLVLLAAEGMTNVQIAGRLDMSSVVVGRWRKRFQLERVEGLSEKARSGRPGRFPPGGGRRGQGSRVRAAQDPGRSALTL